MLDQQPYITLSSVDGSGSPGLSRVYVQRGITVATALPAAQTLRSRYSTISGCAFVETRFALPATAEPVPIAATSSDVQRCAVFIFETDSPNQYAIVAIPGMHDGLLVATGPGAGVEIDTTQPAIAALVSELINGLWVSVFGYKITALLAAYRQERHAIYVPDWVF